MEITIHQFVYLIHFVAPELNLQSNVREEDALKSVWYGLGFYLYMCSCDLEVWTELLVVILELTLRN